jgi:hypothetical protein
VLYELDMVSRASFWQTFGTIIQRLHVGRAKRRRWQRSCTPRIGNFIDDIHPLWFHVQLDKNYLYMLLILIESSSRWSRTWFIGPSSWRPAKGAPSMCTCRGLPVSSTLTFTSSRWERTQCWWRSAMRRNPPRGRSWTPGVMQFWLLLNHKYWIIGYQTLP